MADAADILVLNRCDTVDPAVADDFRRWAAALEPAKMRLVTTEHGHLADELFELALPAPVGDDPAGHDHHAADHGPAGRAGGATWPAETVFGHGRLTAALAELAEDGLEGVPVERFKGVFHTDRGWFLLQIADGRFSLRETPPRRESAADWILADGTAAGVRERLEAALD
jgi:G3E family GTPase